MAQEWIVIKLDATAPKGYVHHMVGNQSRFEQADAERHLDKLGPGWRLVHWKTLVPPHNHQQWVNNGGKTDWAP